MDNINSHRKKTLKNLSKRENTVLSRRPTTWLPGARASNKTKVVIRSSQQQRVISPYIFISLLVIYVKSLTEGFCLNWHFYYNTVIPRCVKSVSKHQYNLITIHTISQISIYLSIFFFLEAYDYISVYISWIFFFLDLLTQRKRIEISNSRKQTSFSSASRGTSKIS